MHETRAQARTRLGDIPGAHSDLRAALSLRRGPERSRLLGRLAMLASGSDDAVRAAELAELALVEAGRDRAARAQTLEIAAILDMNLGRRERSDERSENTLRLYEDRIIDGGAALRRAAGPRRVQR